MGSSCCSSRVSTEHNSKVKERKRGKIRSDAAGTGCPPTEFGAVVTHCSAEECDAAGRRHWRISERRHMSGSGEFGPELLRILRKRRVETDASLPMPQETKPGQDSMPPPPSMLALSFHEAALGPRRAALISDLGPSVTGHPLQWPGPPPRGHRYSDTPQVLLQLSSSQTAKQR
ncbi:unnamed protein product [Pleuronectes platessa]|uniref:Uncharacterized protein n=1 Tax=Pleuronectes platessa TaxID=8262 RepID=A0A9N7UL17_PLEPL|nr:unnamed protein product [Pleuronectes platessa]